eukprot:scaffold1525_cov142-Cylindrotheca_fusiformis.AAC.183
MKFAAFSLLLTTVSAERAVDLEGSIPAESSLGKRILSKARALEQYNYYVPRFEREEGFTSDLLAKFKLCPSDSCGACRHGGEYVVDMKEFIETYQEAKQQENENACENAQEACENNCQNGYYDFNGDDDEACQYQCLTDKGMSYCAQDQEGDDMRDIGECRALNEQEGGNNNNYQYGNAYQVYYVGAYCTSKGVFAGTFTDSACTKHAPSGTYEKINYGYSLPTDPLVPSGCLASCNAASYNNGNNNGGDNDGNGISEVCEDLYEMAAKCERKVKNISYQDNSGCDLIDDILPRMNHAFHQIAGRPSASVVWAWIFGIACVCMGAYIYLLHKRVIREKVDMSKLGLV